MAHQRGAQALQTKSAPNYPANQPVPLLPPPDLRMTEPTQLATPSTRPYRFTASFMTASTAATSRGSAGATATAAAPAAAAAEEAACSRSSSRPDSSSCAPGCAPSSCARELPMPPVAPNTT